MKAIKAGAVASSVVKHRSSGICGSNQEKLIPIYEVGGNLDFVGLTRDGMEKKLSLSADGRAKQFEPNAWRVSDFVEPSSIGALASVLIFDVAPTEGVGADRNVKNLLLPAGFAREAIGLEIAIDIELKEIEIEFRRGSPPETEPARAADSRSKP